MTEPDSRKNEYGATIYPSDQWLRTIEFIDGTSDQGDDPPVHVIQRVLINGGAKELMLNPGGRVVVHTQQGVQSATLVSFVVHEDEVTVPNYREVAAGGQHNQPTIAGLRVMTPLAEDREHMWAVFKTIEDTGKAWIRVWIMVRSVAFVAAGRDVSP